MKQRHSTGFTLIEIMVVVVIIGILGALIVPRIFDRPDQVRQTAAKTDLRSIANALEMYKLDNFHYPSTDQGLEALVSKPSGFPEAKNYSPTGYLPASSLNDPWGTPYVYINTDNAFELLSLARDGVEGGEGYDADIHYEAQ
jgi:general secretion pathway protein G